MRKILLSIFLSAAAIPAMNPTMAGEPITLRDMGSFHVGGRVVEISGKPVKELVLGAGGVPAKIDPNGLYQVEQMYVQYFLPQNRKGKYPLLMWHGGGLTGVTYETTPDGREGWMNIFIRQGWDVYNSDAVERGRSGFAPPDVWNSEPNFLTKANPFERFRIGEGPGSWNADPAKMKVIPGNQFPVEGYDNFTKQIVPLDQHRRSDHRRLHRAGRQNLPVRAAVPQPGRRLRLHGAQSRPDKIKAIVAVEPAVAGDKAKAGALKNIPTLVVYGDNIPLDSRWPKMRQLGVDYAEAVRSAGGSVDVVNLPEVGIKGNSHMLMMDKNNGQIADLIQKWLTDKGMVE
jgi:pimeloyl-ACP methyl ester carboxylesterase